MSEPKLLPNSSFSSKLPRLQLGIDSTSLGEFKTCPRKYQLSIVLGYQPKAESVHLVFGILLHQAREQYDQLRMQAFSHDEALDKVFDTALRATWNPKLNRPWISDHKLKNRLTLLRTIVWYLDALANNDPIETVKLPNGKAAVELSFRFASGYQSKLTGEDFILCGHLDRLGKFNDQYYIPDIKTTGSTISQNFFDGFTPDNQFSLYTLASKTVFHFPVKGMIVDAVQVAGGFSRFQRQVIPRSDSQVDEWYGELKYWFGQLELCAETNIWPMNDKSCGQYGGCKFRGICSKPPAARQLWLDKDFERRVWDPLVSREI